MDKRVILDYLDSLKLLQLRTLSKSMGMKVSGKKEEVKQRLMNKLDTEDGLNTAYEYFLQNNQLPTPIYEAKAVPKVDGGVEEPIDNNNNQPSKKEQASGSKSEEPDVFEGQLAGQVLKKQVVVDMLDAMTLKQLQQLAKSVGATKQGLKEKVKERLIAKLDSESGLNLAYAYFLHNHQLPKPIPEAESAPKVDDRMEPSQNEIQSQSIKEASPEGKSDEPQVFEGLRGYYLDSITSGSIILKITGTNKHWIIQTKNELATFFSLYATDFCFKTEVSNFLLPNFPTEKESWPMPSPIEEALTASQEIAFFFDVVFGPNRLRIHGPTASIVKAARHYLCGYYQRTRFSRFKKPNAESETDDKPTDVPPEVLEEAYHVCRITIGLMTLKVSGKNADLVEKARKELVIFFATHGRDYCRHTKCPGVILANPPPPVDSMTFRALSDERNKGNRTHTFFFDVGCGDDCIRVHGLSSEWVKSTRYYLCGYFQGAKENV